MPDSQFNVNAGAGILYRTVADDDLDEVTLLRRTGCQSQLVPYNLSFNDALTGSRISPMPSWGVNRPVPVF